MIFDPNTVCEYAVVDGARMHYRKSGSGPPLILIHGLVSSGAAWHLNIHVLAQHSTVYAVDLLGLGLSDRVPGLDASLDAVAQRMFLFMDAVGIKSADVIGNSQGGSVAFKMASHHPHRVAALIQVAPANPYSHGSDWLIGFYRTALGGMVASVSPWTPRWMRMIFLRRMFGDTRRIPPNSLECHTVGLRIKGTTQHVLQSLKTWPQDMASLSADIAAIADRRVLFIWGDHDRAVSVESAKVLQAQLPYSELSVYKGVGHIPYEEVPERFNHEVAAWLQSSRQLQ